jgi:HlyD family secretion protein
MRRLVKLALTALAIVTVGASVRSFGGFGEAAGEGPVYRLATVSRGPIATTISATGTLKAVVTVDVGTQVSGMVKTLHADFNSEVEAGQVVARIDAAPFEARLAEAEAELAIARASVAMQDAALAEADAEMAGQRAALTAANDDLRRKRELVGKGVERIGALDAAVMAQEQADARVKAAQARLVRQKAQIELARAQVEQKMATVQQRRLDLDYTYIRSPVRGVVISRNVDAGQTVAASLQAPVLFRIAENLSRMQVSVSVDEADIGRVVSGQRVIFAVDAFPERSFEGRVEQIRKASQEISNVVTYTVVVNADNDEQLLLPGMTASVRFVVGQRASALKVPIAALRLRLADRRNVEPRDGDWVWTVDESERPRLVSVGSGITNASESEIVEGELQEGQRVIIGTVAAPRRPERWSWLRFGS